MNKPRGCLSKILWTTGGTLVLAIAALVLLAVFGEGEKPIGELLPTLPASERQALEELCQAGGFKATDLRPLGVTTEALLRDARNARSVVIRDGHVRVVSLRDTSFAALPDLSALTELESLWLENGKLATWPNLSSLGKLTELQLNGHPLPSPGNTTLPASLKKLGLSGTQVEDIGKLTVLALDEVNLSGTPLKRLPDQVPGAGEWSLNLDNTPVTRPSGFSPEIPAGITTSGPTLPGGKIEGMAGHGKVSVRITGEKLGGATTLSLPTNTTLYHTSGPVEAECRVASGRMRIWMLEPQGLWDGPWFKSGKIKGFGLVRRVGYVTGEVGPGAPVVATRGELMVLGTPPHFSFALRLEPLGSEPVTGIELNLRSTP